MFRKVNTSVVAALLLTSAAVQAGVVGGSRRHVDVVSPFSTDSYHVTFRGGEAAVVIVSGDGSTDLDLYVYDANRNLIAFDDDSTDDCIVRFTPRWTGSFTICIVNRGRLPNLYVLATN